MTDGGKKVYSSFEGNPTIMAEFISVLRKELRKVTETMSVCSGSCEFNPNKIRGLLTDRKRDITKEISESLLTDRLNEEKIAELEAENSLLRSKLEEISQEEDYVESQSTGIKYYYKTAGAKKAEAIMKSLPESNSLSAIRAVIEAKLEWCGNGMGAYCVSDEQSAKYMKAVCTLTKIFSKER